MEEVETVGGDGVVRVESEDPLRIRRLDPLVQSLDQLPVVLKNEVLRVLGQRGDSLFQPCFVATPPERNDNRYVQGDQPLRGDNSLVSDRLGGQSLKRGDNLGAVAVLTLVEENVFHAVAKVTDGLRDLLGNHLVRAPALGGKPVVVRPRLGGTRLDDLDVIDAVTIRRAKPLLNLIAERCVPLVENRLGLGVVYGEASDGVLVVGYAPEIPAEVLNRSLLLPGGETLRAKASDHPLLGIAAGLEGALAVNRGANHNTVAPMLANESSQAEITP